MFAIELSHVSKQYKSQTYALKDLSLKVQEGDFFAFLGPNGAGKSTTIGIISSLVVKTAGQVKIGGYDLDENPTKAKKCLGLVPQEFNLNVFESCLAILINQAGYYGVSKNIAYERAEKYLNLLMLWNERNHQVRTLSGGMKRRLMIARALIHNPPILILDEPTAGVDVELRKLIWNFLENLNKDEKKNNCPHDSLLRRSRKALSPCGYHQQRKACFQGFFNRACQPTSWAKLYFEFRRSDESSYKRKTKNSSL